MKVLFIFELGEMPEEWQMPSLIKEFESRKPNWRLKYLHAPVNKYYPGGLHPIRVFNLLWMHLVLPFIILFYKPKWIIVRTSPPMIQHTALLWGCLFGTKTICWLMDYHPLIEQRILHKFRFLYPLTRLLDTLDKFALKKFSLVVCADNAMKALCKQRAPETKVLQFPTWGHSVNVKTLKNDLHKELNLVYAGNLGKGHELILLETLLAEIRKTHTTHLYYIGKDMHAKKIFEKLCQNTRTQFYHHAFQKDLHEFYRQYQIHYGVILMKESMSGLISPSKYTGYIFNGLPVIYIGPKGSNAEEVCSKFNGGVGIPKPATANTIQQNAHNITDPEKYQSLCKGAYNASLYFKNLSEKKLTDYLVPILEANSPG